MSRGHAGRGHAGRAACIDKKLDVILSRMFMLAACSAPSPAENKLWAINALSWGLAPGGAPNPGSRVKSQEGVVLSQGRGQREDPWGARGG
ncbi:hypothetical protein DSECCO2_608760 [anaerobic digester metagenome]